MAILASDYYHRFIEQRFNVARWITYALSQPFQMFAVIVVTGISELDSVVIFSVESFLSVGLLLVLEQNSKNESGKSVAALLWGLVAAILLVHFGIWALIFYNAYSIVIPGGIPYVIQALIIGVFVLITLVAVVNILNTALSYCKVTNYYIYIEWAYQILDVLNVLYFVLIIVIGLTTVKIPG
jgi:hypothetical protein